MRRRYSSRQFELDVAALARKLRPLLRRFDAIYGVPRGGLVLAVYLSHRLGKPLLLDPRRITRRTLIVDDIADSGETLQAILARRKRWKVITLFKTAHSAVQPDFSRRTKKKGDWIVFPWETARSSRYDS